MKLLLAIVLLPSFFLISQAQKRSQEQAPRPNVLFIFVDDLRPELGCYGNSYIHSPNIDELASKATVFQHQFVTVPTCGASRTSLLSGRLPRSIHDLSNAAFEMKQSGKLEKTIPESFVENLRLNGYYTVGIGKISHSPDGYIYGYLQPKGAALELPASWDEMLFDAGKWGTGWNAFFGYSDGTNRNTLKNQVKPYEKGNVHDRGYPDGLTASLAIKKIKELAAKDKPFFLGVGFLKPHLPFNAPKKYWDMYDESRIAITPSPDIPVNVNPASLHESGEFRGYQLGDESASLSKPVSDAYARKLRHAYYASISYIDAQIGKVLNELKKSGLDKNTIIVLWGDHGWHLGDDRVWGKHTLSEWALRSPLIIKTPGLKQGATCNEIVSSIDIYPTLMQLCRVEMPYQTDGKSLVPLLKDSKDKDWENVAYSYFNRGITVRTDNYRFTKYFRKEKPVVELYDHQKNSYELKNIVGYHDDIVKHLMPVWEKGNTGLYDKMGQ